MSRLHPSLPVGFSWKWRARGCWSFSGLRGIKENGCLLSGSWTQDGGRRCKEPTRGLPTSPWDLGSPLPALSPDGTHLVWGPTWSLLLCGPSLWVGVTLEMSHLVASQQLCFFHGRKLGLYRPATWINLDYCHFRLLFSKVGNRPGTCGK